MNVKPRCVEVVPESCAISNVKCVRLGVAKRTVKVEYGSMLHPFVATLFLKNEG